MKKIKINLEENSYEVLIGSGIINRLNSEALKRAIPENYFAIVDANVNRKHKSDVDKLIDNNARVIFKSSEKNKSYESLQKIHKKMISAGLGRSSSVLAFGGGIVGDVTGFAASTYMRGIKYIQVPTTLLAAVDSSVGGKTGINFNETKNVIGSFYQPSLVLIDTEFFKTLPEEEIICGAGELVKYAFIIDKQFYNYLNRNIDKVLKLDGKVIQRVVSDSVKYKGSVVASDEKESGLRKVLNFGHTFAHAIEVEQKHRIKHGQAVVAGIACALHLSNRLGLINEAELQKHIEFISRFKNMIKLSSFNKGKLYKVMLRDKKNSDGRIKFVLLKGVGEMLIDVEADKADVYYAIEKGLNIFSNK